MSRNKSHARPHKRAQRGDRRQQRAKPTETAKVWPKKLIGAKYVRLLGLRRQVR